LLAKSNLCNVPVLSIRRPFTTDDSDRDFGMMTNKRILRKHKSKGTHDITIESSLSNIEFIQNILVENQVVNNENDTTVSSSISFPIPMKKER
jgi:hypothetical protein